jgi:hypothetical protein
MSQQILNDKFPFVKDHTLINKLHNISMKDLSELNLVFYTCTLLILVELPTFTINITKMVFLLECFDK